MVFPIHLRGPRNGRWLGAWLLGCLVLANSAMATPAQAPTTPVQAEPGQAKSAQDAPAQPVQGAAGAATAGTAVGPHPAQAAPSKRHTREAEDAYLAGAKKLQQDNLDGAEREFLRAQKLDPENRDYAIAITVAREHRVTELVQQSSKQRLAGNQAQAEKLLSEAQAIDPQNPLVIEHSRASFGSSASAVGAAETASGQVAGRSGDAASSTETSPLTDRAAMLSGDTVREPWSIQAPVLAGAILLAPSDAVRSFHQHGVSTNVLRDVEAAYGIRAVIEDTVERKDLRFDLEKVDYQQAMTVLMEMAHVFAVPLDETSVLIAKDTPQNRQRLERKLEETIYLPGSTTAQINELTNVVRNIFDVKQATAQAAAGSIVVRAPQNVLAPMNRVITDLIDSGGEVLVEVKMYEVDTTRTNNVGASIPTQAGVYNVDQAATSLVNANQSLVQEGISQGLISPTASTLTIAEELIASGLVQSTLLASTVGVFGGGTMLTGITETGNVAFNLGLNSTDTRALDDVQMRVGDWQQATFREGTRYPIVTSTYSSGVSSSATSALSNTSINGVNVGSLLSQYAGGLNETVPQVTYEDLGVTLSTTPVIQKSGRVNLLMDMKIEALSGSTSDGNPILDDREFKSDITVGEGESVLMVSNVSRTETAAMAGIPGLSELPGFQTPTSATLEKDTDQLVLVVTPHIVRRRSDMVAGPRILVRAQPTD